MVHRLATATASLLSLIRRHQRIHDFCLRTAHALTHLPGGARLVRAIQETQRPPGPAAAYADWLVQFDTLSADDRQKIARHSERLVCRPTCSLLLPIVSADHTSLTATIDSVRQQIYPDWELCIALHTAAGQSPAVSSLVAAAAAADPRIKIAEALSAGDEASVANAALALATGDFVGVIAAGDLLAEQAFYEMAAEINLRPDAEILFSDEDQLDPAGHRCRPILKTGWNPEMMLSHNMVGNLALFRRRLLKDIGGFRSGFGESRDYDLILRASAATPAKRIRHLPLVLHHSRGPHEARGPESPIQSSAQRAVSEHLARTGQKGATVAPLPGAPGWLAIGRQVPCPPPLVSVVIPTRDRADLLEKCLAGLLAATDYPALEVIVADNGSCEPATFRLFDRLAADPRVRILACPGPFNYSAINNKAVGESRGEILLLLNNDILIRHPGWLSAMVAQAVRPEVGAVGAKLLYDNGTIQHAGVILGVGSIEPVAGHAYEQTAADAPGYLNHLRVARNMSAVTAACLAMRRSVFDEVGGFDEQHLPVAFNDVDLCLKIGAHGYQIIWTPQAELTHLESLSRGSDLRPEAIDRFKQAIAHMQQTWGSQLESDPFYGPNFDQRWVDYSLAFPPRRKKTWLRRTSLAPKAAEPASLLAVHAESTTAQRQYAVLHIPKTAGTTLREILIAAFPEDIFPTTQDLHNNKGHYLSSVQAKQQRATIATKRFFMGHYVLSDLLDLFPDRVIITCLREPYARTVSMFGHFSRVRGIQPQDLLQDKSFLAGYVINQQTRHLVSSTFTSADWTVSQSESLVEQAIANLARVHIVGLQERFPQFLARVAAELHFPEQIVLHRRENIGPEKTNETLLPYADQIRELIAGDLELYRQVRLRAGSEQVP